MTLRKLIARTLAIFVIAGVLALPQKIYAAAEMPSPSAALTPAAMPSDMPCCPDEPDVKPCPDCPLFALCMVKGALSGGPSTANAVPFRVSHKTLHVVRDDIIFGGLDRPPPDHPPRSSI